MADTSNPGELRRLDPSSFGSLINDIEYQKSYLFRIILPIIDLGYITLKPNNKFELCTSSTAFPVAQVSTTNVAFYNSELKIASKTTYSNWNATFKLDLNKQTGSADWSIPGIPTSIGPTSPISGLAPTSTYNYFNSWLSASFNPVARISTLPVYYKKWIILSLLNEAGDDTSTFVLWGVFPTSISGGSLDYGNDSILTYQVDFAFDRYSVEG